MNVLLKLFTVPIASYGATLLTVAICVDTWGGRPRRQGGVDSRYRANGGFAIGETSGF